MRDKVIAYLQKTREENKPYYGDGDPLNHEMLDFEVHEDLNQHTDEELIEILAFQGVFEGIPFWWSMACGS